MNEDAIAWLRSDEGIRWSRRRHGGDEPMPGRLPPPTQWHFQGPLEPALDPCGSGPLRAGRVR